MSMKAVITVIMIIAADGCIVSCGTFSKIDVNNKRSEVKMMKIIREYQGLEEYQLTDLRVKNNSTCSCQNYTCGCCLHLEVEKISLNDTACVNISYLPDEYGFQFLFILDGKVILNEKISVKNPPPICAAIPYIHKLASLCIRFYNLDFQNKTFVGCADIEAELEGVVVKKYDLGCFRIPPAKLISGNKNNIRQLEP